MNKHHWYLAGVLFLFSCWFGVAQAAQQTFNFRYYDAVSGAQAVGTITLDPTLLTATVNFPSPAVTALTVTVSGSTGGDGTFTLSDFDYLFFDDGGGTLDFSRELVGQPTTGGNVWGPGNNGSGDFNLFGTACNQAGSPNAPSGGNTGNAPVGTEPFELTAEDSGCTFQEAMLLSSFAPAAIATMTAVPATNKWALIALAGLLLLATELGRRRLRG